MAALAVRNELLSSANSLIYGKIQEISSILVPERTADLRPNKGLAAKFPIQQNRELNRWNREFFLRNREPYPHKSEVTLGRPRMRSKVEKIG